MGLPTWCLSYCAEPLQAWAFIIGTALESCHIKVPATDASYIGFLHSQNKLMLSLPNQGNSCEHCSFFLPAAHAVHLNLGELSILQELSLAKHDHVALCSTQQANMAQHGKDPY